MNSSRALFALLILLLLLLQASQRGDPLAALKKQLEEKDKLLSAEQENATASKTRLRELTKVSVHSYTGASPFIVFYLASSFINRSVPSQRVRCGRLSTVFVSPQLTLLIQTHVGVNPASSADCPGSANVHLKTAALGFVLTSR